MREIAALIAVIASAVLTPLSAHAGHGGFDVLVDRNPVPCLSSVPPPLIFATIQGGVDAAAAGDRIGVCPGTYFEEVAVATDGLTIEAIGLVRVMAPWFSPVPRFGFEVTADNATIRGFDVFGFTGAESCGIRVNGAANVLVAGNDVTGNGVGICLLSAWLSTVRDNTVHHNTRADGGPGNGIRVRYGGFARVSRNTVLDNDGEGIVDEASARSNIDRNLTSGNGLSGIILNSAADAVVANNIARDNGAAGVVAFYTAGATIQRNQTSGNGDGVGVFVSHGCVVRLNVATSNSVNGVYIANVSSCTVSRNLSHRNREDGVAARLLGPGNVFERNAASHNAQVDCDWDGSDAPVFMANLCGTENPPGVW